jgi:hypothetical protein
MQSQKRLSTQAAATQKQAEQNKREPQRSAPIVLDPQTLRHVAGGNTSTQGPHKTW